MFEALTLKVVRRVEDNWDPNIFVSNGREVSNRVSGDGRNPHIYQDSVEGPLPIPIVIINTKTNNLLDNQLRSCFLVGLVIHRTHEPFPG